MRNFQVGMAAVVAVSAFVFVGCGGGGGGNNSSSSPSQNPLIGTYKAASIETASGQQMPCPGSFTLAPTVFLECGSNDTSTFGADGTLTNFDSLHNQTFIETYTVNGNIVTINAPANGADAAFSSTFQFSISGSLLTLKQISSTSPDPTLGSDYNGSSSVGQKQ